MKLRLMLKGPSRLMSAIPEKVFDTGGIVIGRAPEADWMIPDPDRIVSKAHCRIDKTDRGYMVTDTSTNGVRINDIPVGRDAPGLLSSGDTLRLGDAIIGVEIEMPIADLSAASPIIPEPLATAPVIFGPPPVEGATDPFLEGPFGFDEAAAKPKEIIMPVVQQPLGETAKGQILQDWWDPNAASGKPGLPLSETIASSGALPTNATTGGDTGMAPSEIGGTETLLKAAEGVDAQALVRAVETAVLVLSEGDRQKFDRRLRELLRGETSR